MSNALEAAFKAVSALTSWADNVIIEGHVEPDQDFVSDVIEPVRRAVIVVVNCLSLHIGKRSLARGNSLPDITSESCDHGPGHDSILDLSPIKPPLLPRISLHADSAPPLPPKHTKPRFDKSFEEMIVQSGGLRHEDWFTTPTFDVAAAMARLGHVGQHRISSHHSHQKQQMYNNHHQVYNNDRTLPSPRGGLETTLPDNNSTPTRSGYQMSRVHWPTGRKLDLIIIKIKYYSGSLSIFYV